MRWEALLARAREMPRLRLAVVGGGAGGVELALSAQHRLAGLKGDTVEVTLVTREALLPSHNARVRRLFEHILADRRVTVHAGSAVACVAPGVLLCADGTRVEFDEALWVTEAGTAPWLADTGLPLTPEGFIAIDDRLRPMPLAFTLVALEFLFRMRRLAMADQRPREDAVSAS